MIAGRKKATGGAKGTTSTTRRYLAGLLLYGTNGVAASFIHMSSLAIVLLRTLLGSLLLTAIFYGSGGRLRGEKRKDCVFVLLSGAAMGLDWLLLFEAYARIGVSLGVVINYCGPVLVMLAASILFHERLQASSWAALELAMLGAAMILGGTAVLELREKRSDPLFCGTFPRHTMP